MNIEWWKYVSGYGYLYMVSTKGIVKSMRKNVILKPSVVNGHLQVVLTDLEGVHKHYFIHRLVAEAFIPNPNNKPCVDHINTIRNDNRVENLRWVTHKENSNNPLTLKHLSTGNMGHKLSDEHKKKLSIAHTDNPKKFKSVIQYTLDGQLVAEYPSIKEVSKQTGIDKCHISSCCQGKRKTAGGYIWKYSLQPVCV